MSTKSMMGYCHGSQWYDMALSWRPSDQDKYNLSINLSTICWWTRWDIVMGTKSTMGHCHGNQEHDGIMSWWPWIWWGTIMMTMNGHYHGDQDKCHLSINIWDEHMLVIKWILSISIYTFFNDISSPAYLCCAPHTGRIYCQRALVCRPSPQRRTRSCIESPQRSLPLH